MDTAPIVSVIVPVYNAKRYLKKCVRSLQVQTEQDIEIILVDDGSTDGSGDICDAFAAKDARIVVCHKKNGGVSEARNKGLEIARGKYIMFCDSDDEVLPRYCQSHVEAMEQTGAALTIVTTLPIPQGIAAIDHGTDRKCFPDYRTLLKLWSAGWLWSCWGKCFVRHLIERWKLTFHADISHGEDAVFVIEYITHLLDKPAQICMWQEHLYRYYDTPGSLSKITSGQAGSLSGKMKVLQEMDKVVGFDRREFEDLTILDRVELADLAFKDSLRPYRIWQIRKGTRAVKKALDKPDMREVLLESQRLCVFGSIYTRVLRIGNPFILFVFLHIRWIILEGPAVKLLRWRRLKKR